MDLRPHIFPHSVVKQDVRNPHFSGQKIFLMLFRKKTLERGSFGKRGRRCITPPPHPFWDKMAQDIQTAKLLNSLLEIANKY